MTYSKNHASWAAGDALTTTVLNNFETEYTEASSYLSTHGHTASYYTKTEMNATFWSGNNDGSGSGSDADLIYKSTGNLHASAFSGLGIPTGLVIEWYGAIAAIPSGWHICDGAGGTVDLRDKMIVGAGTGGSYAVGNTGTGTHAPAGTVTIAGHALTTAEVAGHQHTFTDRAGWSNGDGSAWAGGGELLNQRYATAPSGYASTTGNSNIGKATADAHGHSGGEGTAFSGNNFTALPPYYALAFIQKM